MPSDLTISKLKGTTTPAASTREQRIAASHRKAGAYAEIYPNVYGEGPVPEIEQILETTKLLGMGAGAAAVGGLADLTAMGTAIVKNLHNMAKGEEWAWPEDFRNVPATSDWWGTQMGLTKEQTDNLAFIGGGVALGRGALDEKLVSKTLKTAKLFQGSKKTAVAKRIVAEKLYSKGATDDEVWKETGWWPYKDDAGKVDWKFYVSDEDAVINYDNLGKLARERTVLDPPNVGETRTIQMRMDQILDHPALYELYPEIGGYKINVNVEKVGEDSYKLAKDKGGAVAGFNPVTRRFQLKGSRGDSDARSSLLHEAQHAIQAIEQWQGGASNTHMQSAFFNYHAAAIMDDLYKNVDSYLDLDELQLEEALMAAVGDKELVDVMVAEAGNLLLGLGNEDEVFERAIYWAGAKSRFMDESQRWLQTAVHFDERNFEDVLEGLDAGTVQSLAALRYYLDLGEVEARLTQALANVPQAKIDKFSMSPHKLARYLGRENVEGVQKQIPEVQRMEEAVPIEHAVTDSSRGKLEDLGLVDTQNIP